jgi:hypothetical protein
VLANWAFFWGTVANMNIATVATLPNRYAVSLEDHAIFNVFE